MPDASWSTRTSEPPATGLARSRHATNRILRRASRPDPAGRNAAGSDRVGRRGPGMAWPKTSAEPSPALPGRPVSAGKAPESSFMQLHAAAGANPRYSSQALFVQLHAAAGASPRYSSQALISYVKIAELFG